MVTSRRIAVFDAHMLRGLAINNENIFPDILQAFRIAFQARRFRILITDGILEEYRSEANNVPQFQVQPTLNSLFTGSRAVHLHEYRLNRFQVTLSGLPQEHTAFILDAIAAQATYFITDYLPWLNLSEQTEDKYGLQIVEPRKFVEIEG